MTSRFLPRDWNANHWPDLASASDQVADRIAVLPLAATEQHGPHLPLGTDVMIAEAYLDRVRSMLGDTSPVIILPVQPVGISSEHVDYPGTLTLPPDIAIRSWIALGESIARAGIRKMVIVTSHGGNSAAMQIVAQELRAHQTMLVVTTSWGRLSAADKLFPPEEIRDGVHGGAVETSIMLAAWPQHVRRGAIDNFASLTRQRDANFNVLSAARPAPYAWQAQDLHPQGVVGDAGRASAEAGQRLPAIRRGAFPDTAA